MKNATEMKSIAQSVIDTRKATVRNAALTVLENTVEPEIEARAQDGRFDAKCVIETGIDSDIIVQELRNAGYTVRLDGRVLRIYW